MNEDYDVIVIGAGFGGIATAIQTAKYGLKTMLIDRGDPVGSKNLSGGVLWGHELDELLGEGWWEKAPLERHIVQKKISLLTEDNSFVLDWRFDEWAHEPYNGWSILRAKFDPWFAQQAELAGAEVYSGIKIDEFAYDDGRIVGIRESGDTFRANVVVIADGANSRLTLKAGLRDEMPPRDYLLGIKEVHHMNGSLINDKFSLGEGQGMASEHIIGYLDGGVLAGGFLYTNKSSISLGIVVHLETLWEKGIKSTDILEQFKQHPLISNMIEGGSMIEYGAHLVPESGYKMMPRLSGDGFLVVGDAAGFVFSNGLVIQGMNYAARSGIIAAEAIKAAHDAGDFSARSLKRYERLLKQSYVLKDLKKFKKVHKITKNPRIFKEYPAFATDVFKDFMTERMQPKRTFLGTARRAMKRNKISMFTLIRDALRGRHI